MKIRAIHVDSHRRRQLQSRLPSTQLNGVIYIMDNDYWYDYRYHWCIDGQSSRYGAVIADRGAAPNVKYNNREGSKVASRYYSWQSSSIITIGTWLDDRIWSLGREREPSAPTLFNFIKHRPTSEHGYALIRWYTNMVFMIAVVMFICSGDSLDPWGYRMDRLGTLRRPADSACI